MSRIGTEQFSGNQATILVHGKRASASGAALANGFAGNALDIDDGYRLVKGHPGAFIIMPGLNCCQALEVSGEELLCAVAAGYEVAMRAAVVTHDYYHHYHASGSWGGTGTAALAGKPPSTV